MIDWIELMSRSPAIAYDVALLVSARGERTPFGRTSAFFTSVFAAHVGCLSDMTDFRTLAMLTLLRRRRTLKCGNDLGFSPH